MTEIVHFVHALNGRALADIACCLAEEMQRAGRDTVVVASAVTPGVRRPRGVELIDLGGSGRRTLPTTRALARVLRDRAPRTIFAHAEGPTRTSLAARALVRPRPQLVGISHNHYSSYAWSHPRRRRLVDGMLLPRADALVGVSPGVAEDLVATFPIAAGRVHMVPEPLTRWAALPDLAAEPFDHPWAGGARPLVVSVGHVHPRKDQETLVRAFVEVVRRRADGPRLLIIGDDGDPYAARIRSLITGLDADDAIALLGNVPNPLPHVAAADLFVLSSRNEGLPVALLEAMAIGTPIVSTEAHAGPRHALDGGRGGLLTPVGDPPALAAAICRMLDEPDLRQGMAAASRERVAGFTPARVAARYLDVADGLR